MPSNHCAKPEFMLHFSSALAFRLEWVAFRNTLPPTVRFLPFGGTDDNGGGAGSGDVGCSSGDGGCGDGGGSDGDDDISAVTFFPWCTLPCKASTNSGASPSERTSRKTLPDAFPFGAYSSKTALYGTSLAAVSLNTALMSSSVVHQERSHTKPDALG